MKKLFWSIILIILISGSALAQVAAPAASQGGQPAAGTGDDLAPKPGGNVGLMRGVVKRVDPIHDQLLIHIFGGHDIRIAFDPRTQFFPEKTGAHLASLPAGSVVSVDTVIDHGKLFALSVRTGAAEATELNGQVQQYDAARGQLTLRDPESPTSISVRITPNTTIVNRGEPASAQILAPGMLVRVSFVPAKDVANHVEILAERGGSFTFSGRIIAVDLRSHVLSLFNDSDQSVRELAIGALDGNSVALLREGTEVNIQAEFDGDRYNVRTLTPLSRNP
jgi:Domain of unknown function (DUF5666)